MSHEIDKRGGLRQGSGRKKGSGKFGEPTRVMRIPHSKVTAIQAWLNLSSNKNSTDVLDGTVPKVGLGLDKSNKDFSGFGWYLPANDVSFIELPLYSHKVVAGFPSPADDYVEERLDLNEKLIHNKEATFLLVVQGDSMQNIGIKDGDTLIVDRSLEPRDGKIVIAALDGELTVKRLSMKSTGTWLVPENDDYPPILVREESDIVIWGVVTSAISQF
ncbi:LexA family protein [Thiomicrorhabdus arctica]|jgi:DNA polymerase V|uniref:LexA family protein n=1 Tax=Thiomicrorhabdus arctica TaxID=131540 RepID=UPI0003771F78|nr:translesion error-prone DNA polymerase V autoproteolytic subunit [Thiomicrorhabdus arctica]